MSHEDDEGLWDELNHQQNREIEQHRHRFGAVAAHKHTHVSSATHTAPPPAAFGRLQRPSLVSLSAPIPAGIDNGGSSYFSGVIRDPETLRWIDSSSNGHGNGTGSDAGTIHHHHPYHAGGHRRWGTLQQTGHEAARLWQVFGDALASGWKSAQQLQHEHQTRRHQNQQHQYQGVHQPQPDSLDEFGIPRLGTSGLLSNSRDDDGEVETDAHQGSNGGSIDRRRRDYVLLPRLSRNPTWGAAPNLDVYFSSLYTYYYHRGFVPILTKGIVDLVGLFFTLVLSVFLFAFVNWDELFQCIDESSCHPHFGAYLHQQPFRIYPWSSWTALVVTYAALFAAYGAFAIWTFWHVLRQASVAEWVFENRLGISRRKLEGGAVDWDSDVVAKLVQLQESGEYRVAIHQNSDQLNALVIANRIMRKENFLIAMFNCGVLDLTVPLLKGQTFFCSSIEWVLHFAVLNFLFNHKYQIRPAFYLDPAGLRRRFILCGVVHAIFLPFVLFFLTLHFGFQNAYDWKSTKKYLGPREWSLYSRWLFREFNELPHSFERRLAPSYQVTEEYLKLFGSSGTTAALGRVLVFMSGSVGAVLFLFAAINDAILLHVKIADWNLLWYAGVVGVVYSVGKSMVPSDESLVHPRSIRNLLAETDAALQNVATHTHYYLESWKGRGADPATFATVTSMFKFKANLFAMEVLSVVVAPYILCVSLAQSSERICEFVVAVKEEIVGAGEVCGFATFDFDKYADEAWEGKTMGPTAAVRESDPDHHPTLAESIAYTGNVERAAEQLLKPKTRHGKMEKSFFSFMASHPSWQCSASGQDLVDRVAQYERDNTQAFSREQQLHIDAAARQLETLARWEQQRRTPDAFNVRGLDESYIPKTAQAPADAGAGLHPEAASPYYPQYQPPRSQFLEASYSGASPQRSPLSLSRTADSISVAPQADDPILPFASAGADGSPRARPPPTTASLSHSLAPSRSLAAGSGGPPMAATSTTSPTSHGLSSELRRILNLSSLDPDVRSVVLGRSAMMMGVGAGGTAMGASDFGLGAATSAESSASGSVEDRRMERQYMWLERYHAHVAAQQQGQMQGSATAEGTSAAVAAHTDFAARGQPNQRQRQQPTPPSSNRSARDEEASDESSYQPFGSIV